MPVLIDQKLWLTRQLKTKELKVLGVQRYYKERKTVRDIAIEHSIKNTVLELYAGNGGMTKLYNVYFKSVITNDSDPGATSMYHMKALVFIRTVLPSLISSIKIDLVDFDAYGNPSYEIQEFFNVAKDSMKPIVVVITDGLGLRMKRVKDEEGLMKRYLLASKDQFDLSKSWLYHPQLVNNMMYKIAEKWNMTLTPLYIIQGLGKNFVFSSFLLS